MKTYNALIAGVDYFDNAKCSVILDNLVIKIDYKFLVKPELLMNELAKENYNLVIFALDMEKSILESFKSKFLNNNNPVQCLFFGKYSKENYKDFFYGINEEVNNFPFLSTPFTPIKFSEALSEILFAPTLEVQKPKNELKDYVAIKLQFLRKFAEIPFDIFIQLSEEKHVRLRKKGDKLDDGLISRYKSKGVKEFFITSEDFNNYHEVIYTHQLLLNNQKNFSPEQQAKEIHHVLVEVLGDIGLNEIVIDLAHQYTKNILAYSGTKASIALMLEACIKNDYSYIYDHSYITSIICVKVSRKLNWMTTSMEEKICMAAVFHDLYLGDTNNPYKIDVVGNSLNQFEKHERELYISHPARMAALLSESDDIPQEAINIVSQHHEKIDGTGFPKKLSSLTMSPTVGLFIMVHDFVNDLYRANFDYNKYRTLIINTVEKYKVGNFKEIAKAFESAMLEELQ